MNIEILVVTHKNLSDSLIKGRIPILVGNQKDFIDHPKICYRDDLNDNISEKNKNYSELTAIYWAWKNIDKGIIGIEHYRRRFCHKKEPLETDIIEEKLQDHDMIVTKKVFRPNILKRDYEKHHIIEDLKVTREVILELYPEYTQVFDIVMTRDWYHSLNMFITKKETFNAYCSWLFDILFAVEDRIEVCGRDVYQARVFGFLSERLLDVWITYNKIKIYETEVEFLEMNSYLVSMKKMNQKILSMKSKIFCINGDK